MKKTIVAAAVAAVFAAPAMADVKISGNVYLEAGEVAEVSTDKVNTDLFVVSTEDLGNGMTVTTKIQMVNDNDGATNASADPGERSLAISGAFGEIKGGLMETYTESAVAAMAANDPAHNVSNEVSDSNLAGYKAGHRYTSPSFNGVKVIAETFPGQASTVGVEYSGNGLTVKYAQEKGSSATLDVDTFAISYKFEGLTATVVNSDDSSGEDQTWYGVSYNMGPITAAYSVINGNGDSGDTASDDGDSTLSVAYALSKSTTAYIAMENDDSANTLDQTLVGVVHKF
jgi:hypothetical protein